MECVVIEVELEHLPLQVGRSAQNWYLRKAALRWCPATSAGFEGRMSEFSTST